MLPFAAPAAATQENTPIRGGEAVMRWRKTRPPGRSGAIASSLNVALRLFLTLEAAAEIDFHLAEILLVAADHVVE